MTYSFNYPTVLKSLISDSCASPYNHKLYKYINIEKSTSKYIYIYIYIRLELCLSTFVYPCGPVVRVVDLRPRVWGLIESASCPCVVKDGSHIVIWTSCKITLNQ